MILMLFYRFYTNNNISSHKSYKFRSLKILHLAPNISQVQTQHSIPVNNPQPVLTLKVSQLSPQNLIVTSYFQDDPESQPTEEGGTNLEGSLLIIPWSCLIVLLGICKTPGCGDQVLGDNMDIRRNGKRALIYFENICKNNESPLNLSIPYL